MRRRRAQFRLPARHDASAAWARRSARCPNISRWSRAGARQHTRMPVIVKLTPNITDIRQPARAAQARRRRRGVADQHHQLDHCASISTAWRPTPTIDGKGTHGGYCGPAVKPIALNMVAEIARDPETRGLPISGIGGITTWRDAAEFIALGAGNVQVCTAAMTYGFKIVEEMIAGLVATGWTRRATRRSTTSVGRAVPQRHRLAVPQPQLRRQGADRPGPLHQVRPLPHRLRGHLAPGDHARRWTASGISRSSTPNASAAISASMSARSRTASRWCSRPQGVDPRTGLDYRPPATRNWTTHPNNPAVHTRAAE